MDFLKVMAIVLILDMVILLWFFYEWFFVLQFQVKIYTIKRITENHCFLGGSSPVMTGFVLQRVFRCLKPLRIPKISGGGESEV